MIGQISLMNWLKRFLATWRDLIFKPTQFFHTSLEEKRRSYVPAWQFYVISTTTIGVATNATNYGVLWVQDPEAPLPSAVSYIMPGQIDPFIAAAEIVLACFLWFFVAHEIFGVKTRIKTPSLFKRLFSELLFFESGPALLVPFISVFLVLPVVWFAVTFFFLPTAGVLNDDSDVLGYLWVAGALGLLLSLVVIPCVISVGYTYAFARTLFVLKRIPALVLATTSAVVVPFVYICALLFFAVVHLQQLSFEDKKVVDFLKAVQRIEEIYKQKAGRYGDLKELHSVGEMQAALQGRLTELKLLKDTSSDLLSHRLIFQLTNKGGYAHALPKNNLQNGGRSYVVSFLDGVVRTCECGGRRAELFDRVVTPF
jgi:hypothetical protein